MAGITNDILSADNVNFTGSDSTVGTVTTDGELLIGSTATPNIKVGTLTSPNSSITIGYSDPNITVDVNGSSVGQTITGNTGGALSPTSGNWNILGSSVASGSTPVSTSGLLSTLTVNVQTAQAIASTNANSIGLASFDSSSFDVDANGFVELQSSALGVLSVLGTPDRITSTGGQNPVIDIASNYVGQTSITTLGTVATGTWNGSTISEAYGGTNQTTYATGDILYASASNTLSKLAAGSDTQVLTLASGVPSWATPTIGTVTSVGVQANDAPGTNPVLPDGGGLITVNGAAVANHSVVLETRSRAANTYNVEIQYAASSAATDETKSGVAHFDSSDFSVDANGFVSVLGTAGFQWSDVSGAFSPLSQNGYFVTGTSTGTLPASPSNGDTIQFFVDHSSQKLTIQASGTQIIRLATQVSSAGGTIQNTQRGDSLELVYRATNNCWCAVSGFNGGWNFT